MSLRPIFYMPMWFLASAGDDPNSSLSAANPDDRLRTFASVWRVSNMLQLLRGFVCILMASSAGLAQTSTAQISGTVKDESGSAIPSAQVKATQAATGAVRTVISGGDGTYVLANLPIGPYTLEVTK